MAASDATTRTAGLSGRATAFLAAVAFAAATAALPAFVRMTADTGDLVTFALLGGAAALAQLAYVEIRHNHGFAIGIAFLLAAALLLPPELVALTSVAQHLPDILRRNYPWYIQTFNTSNYALSALAAWGVARLVSDLETGADGRFALAGAAACLALVLVNHFLLATMLLLARGHSFRASGLFSTESVSIDVVLAAVGFALAGLWDSNAALVVAAAAPLILVNRLLQLMASIGAAARTP